MRDPTNTQLKYLKAIEELTSKFGYPPTNFELGDYLNRNAGCVHSVLACMVERGIISRQPHSARTIKVLYPSSSFEML